MGATIPTKYDAASGLVLNMTAVQASAGETAFDSYLLKHSDGTNNHTLTLVIKVFLNPILPPSANAPPGFRFVFPEWGGALRTIKPWRPRDWNTFAALYQQESLLWNDRFWLIPPPSFSALDVKVGSRTVRPNVYCHLYLDLVGSVAAAHRTIIVVNLDKAANPFFRSDDKHYSSDAVGALDVVTDSQGTPMVMNLPPGAAPPGYTRVKTKLGRPMKYYTIAHELGHALGLPHIGQTHKDPLCQLAIMFNDKKVPQDVVPGILQGGIGAGVCYGVAAPPDRFRNVMGMGSEFDETNAVPWQQRLAQHTLTKSTDWKVSLTKVSPKAVS